MYDLCAIGNALVDIIVPVDEDFLNSNHIKKGAMTLMDDQSSHALYSKAGAAVETTSGGSAANTLSGFSSLGGSGAFLGKVGKDQFGEIFTHDLQAQQINFDMKTASDLSTGRCLILVTPDGQRSMNTFLGAAVEFGPDDVDALPVQKSHITYLEGYLFDKPLAQQAFLKAAKLAHEAKRKVSLTLSDTFCVLRHRAAFLNLVGGEIDILFANENEIKSLYDTADLKLALDACRKHTDIAVVTRGGDGAVIVAGPETHEVKAQAVTNVIDTTGAGDLYAAGFLYGLSRHLSLPECGKIGAMAAAEVISHYGPRPQKKLSTLLGA